MVPRRFLSLSRFLLLRLITFALRHLLLCVPRQRQSVLLLLPRFALPLRLLSFPELPFPFALRLLLFLPRLLPFVLRQRPSVLQLLPQFALPLPLLFFPVLRFLFALLHRLPFFLPRLLLFTPRRHPFVLVLPVTFVTVLAATRLRLLLLHPPLLLDNRRTSR